MDKAGFWGRNLKALSQRHPELCDRLSKLGVNTRRYNFLQSRSGETVPALIDPNGNAHPLHSMVDPRREATRLIDSVKDEGFLIFLGLGGPYYAEAALRSGTGLVLVLEFDLAGLTELLQNLDYALVFEDPRFRLLVDVKGKELESYILGTYQPVLYGGIRVIPLRSRTSLEGGPFAEITGVIETAIDRISSDYSVQARFGRRWFSNIVKNIISAGQDEGSLPAVNRAAVCAAGPSLSLQIPALREKRKDLFIIAVDTSLPCLLNGGIIPDAVISIDCQHYSYYHFMDPLPEEVILFLDLLSPPLLASRSKRLKYFTGRHPFTLYASRVWKSLPELDTSGGNVTYAALSLAEELGATEIGLYGADFSYPGGACYARGSYIYPLFEKRQNRLFPIEAQSSAFLFRTPLKKIRCLTNSLPENGANEGGAIIGGGAASWYYETGILKFYRERLEEKSCLMNAELIPVFGMGAPIDNRQGGKNFPTQMVQRIFSSGKALMSGFEFLQHYKRELLKLPEPKKNAAGYLASLEGQSPFVFTTILPLAAALRHRNSIEDFGELIEKVKSHCCKEIDAALTQ